MKQVLPVLGMVFAWQAGATHIIGGELTYEDLGGGDKLVVLTIYRDCGPTNTNGTGFDPDVEIGVFDAAGNYLFSEIFPFVTSDTVPVQLNNPCLTVPPTICVERSAYTGVISLPGIPGGYVLAYQRCCRTPAILNVLAPNTQGLTCTVEVPDPQLGGNGSPAFIDYPPIAMCVGETFVFDHSASDPDADSLSYALCTPLDGGGQGNPAPSPPTGPPYTPITWAAGFSQTSMMNASPQLAIDPQTGLLTVTPTMIGSYAVGICVSEYRNGVLISTVRRDLRFDVVACQVNLVSAVQQQTSFCDGLTVDFVNLSQNGGSFFWDFGETALSTDTSGLFAPTHTYSDTGTYTVTLVAEPGWPCADTALATFSVHLPLDPEFQAPGPLCASQLPAQLDATGNFTPAAQVSWDLGPAGVPQVLPGDPVLADFSATGVHVVAVTVSEFGCTDSFTDTVRVFADPLAGLAGGPNGCVPLPATFQQLAFAETPLTYQWDFGDGGQSSDPDPQHTYASPGVYDVTLTVWTDSGCVDTASFTAPGLISAFPPPEAGFRVDPPVTNIFEPTVLVTDASTDAVQWTYFVDGQVYEGPQFLHTFSDGGVFTVVQVVSSGLGCSDTASVDVQVVGDILHVPNAFTPDGDGLNDRFLPIVLGADDYELDIFDRWGAAIFSTNDPREGWEGEGLPPGVYAYRIRYTTLGDAPREVLGSVTLLR